MRKLERAIIKARIQLMEVKFVEVKMATKCFCRIGLPVGIASYLKQSERFYFRRIALLTIEYGIVFRTIPLALKY
jgi:hypothetical protein